MRKPKTLTRVPSRFVPTGVGTFKQRTMTAGELIRALNVVHPNTLVGVVVQNVCRSIVLDVVHLSDGETLLWVDGK